MLRTKLFTWVEISKSLSQTQGSSKWSVRAMSLLLQQGMELEASLYALGLPLSWWNLCHLTNLDSLAHCLSNLLIFSHCVFDYLLLTFFLLSLWDSGDMKVTRPLMISSIFSAVDSFLCLLHLLLSVPRQTLILTNILFTAKISTFSLFQVAIYLLRSSTLSFVSSIFLMATSKLLVRSWKHLVHIKAANY